MTSPLAISGALEKRNAIGIWSSKWVEVGSTGQRLTIRDKEGAPVTQTFEIVNVCRSDALTLLFQGKTDELSLRAPSNDVSDDWYESVRDALVDNKIIPHFNFGLPYEDPRNGLTFCEIPPEFHIKFKDLKRSVLYWFGSVTKYGNTNALTGKPKIEERICFLGDKAFYVTRPNSEITRCIKVERLVGLFTNLGSKSLQDKSPFIVLKLDSQGEYDLVFEAKNILPLIRALKVLFRFNSKDKSAQLKVTTVPRYDDPLVAIRLHRPPDFEMVTVIPSSKIELRKRLAVHYKQKGITPPPIERRPRKPRNVPTSTERHPSTLFESRQPVIAAPNPSPPQGDAVATGSESAQTEKPDQSEIPNTDPLAVYLILLGVPQYYFLLYKQQLDLDLLECMDESDFRNFGVADPTHISLIVTKLQDEPFMSEVQSTVEANRKDANWNSKPSKGHGSIISLSDDDDDLPVVAPSAQTTTSRAAIVLDDSDDDVKVESPKPPPKMVINLSDDDDL